MHYGISMPTTPPSILHFDHVQITVPKGDAALAEARRFYLHVLGLVELEAPQVVQNLRGFWVRVGRQSLHVGFQDQIDRAAHNAHFACEVESVDAWRSHLDAHGVSHVTPVELPGWDRIQFRDPFGNMIELLEILAD